MSLRPGQKLGHFRVVEKLGEGGMGVVYRARDEHLDRDVALKILHTETLSNEAARKRFYKEARALSKLNHPNVQTCHDFDTEQGVDFLVTELVPGNSLDESLATGPLGEKEVVRLGVQLAEGLEAAHAQSIVHRDLKPANLRITPEGRLKILDFGLAKLERPVGDVTATQSMTQTQTIVGTLPYMSPEQLRSEPIDARTDIYATGAVLYEMATGQRPFRETQGTLLIDAILHKAPPSPSAVNPRVAPELQSIILKALDKDPEHRYQSTRELRVDLERLGISEVIPAPVVQKPTRRRWVPLVLTPIMVAIAVYLFFFTDLFVGQVQALDSVAVLPFANLSDDPEAEYLSEGITDSLINSLAELPTIKKVIARASVFEYKDQEVDPRVVGRDLGVKAVVTGKIVQRGENLSISVALVQARDSRHLWGDQYRRSMTEIFDVQEDIVSRISEGLRLELTGEQKERLTKRHTVSTDAYKLYLKGRYYLNSRGFTQSAIDNAIGYFKQALEQDPGYALAYVGMADCYYGMSNIYIPSSEAMPKMKAAAIEALKRDDSLGEAHAALGMVKALFDRDWWGAEREFERAIELNPGHAATHLSYALILSTMGRFDQAVTEAERTLELDPLSIHVKVNTAWPYYLGRRYDEAQARLQETIDEAPDYFLPHAILGLVYEQKGELDKSIAAFKSANELPESSLEALAQLGRAYAVAGQMDKAEEVLEQLRALPEDQFVSAYNFAAIHAALGQNDEAIDWLFRADEKRSEWFPMLKIDPRFDSLRADARYQELIRRTGLPD